MRVWHQSGARQRDGLPREASGVELQCYIDRGEAQTDATKREAREREQAATYEDSAKRVQRRAAGLKPIEIATPYMVRKGIEPTIGAMTDGRDGTIHLPAIDTQGKHWTTQYVQEDGTKRFAKDSHKEGCFHVVTGAEPPGRPLPPLPPHRA